MLRPISRRVMMRTVRITTRKAKGDQIHALIEVSRICLNTLVEGHSRAVRPRRVPSGPLIGPISHSVIKMTPSNGPVEAHNGIR